MMVWEILAIWAIVGSVIFWFVRDEKQRRDRELADRARRFAETPHRRAGYRSAEDETLAGAQAARAVALTLPVPSEPPAPAVLAPHELEFIKILRGQSPTRV